MTKLFFRRNVVFYWEPEKLGQSHGVILNFLLDKSCGEKRSPDRFQKRISRLKIIVLKYISSKNDWERQTSKVVMGPICMSYNVIWRSYVLWWKLIQVGRFDDRTSRVIIGMTYENSLNCFPKGKVSVDLWCCG